MFGFRIGEISCPTKYFEEASSINFRRSVQYGLGVLETTLQFALQRAGIIHIPIFSEKGKTLEAGSEAYYEGQLPSASAAALKKPLQQMGCIRDQAAAGVSGGRSMPSSRWRLPNPRTDCSTLAVKRPQLS